jgi:2-polyprenyl-3-methyl-5-hydroxy-6-metoxy-1,4-benzoquinol methylase
MIADPTAEAAAVYDAIAEKYPQAFDNDVSDLLFLERFTSLLPVQVNVLDVGSGTGSLTQRLLRTGFPVEGIGISPQMVVIARRNYPAACRRSS